MKYKLSSSQGGLCQNGRYTFSTPLIIHNGMESSMQ